VPPVRRPFRKPNPVRLANAALFYLSRYAASEASLRRVLENKLRRAAMQDDTFAADHELQATLREAIEKIIETHKATGALNDAAYAEMKVHSLRRSGRSARMITQKLSQKGLKADVIERALVPEYEDETPVDVEIRAARALAKRRALGPYRKATTRPALTEAEEAKRKAKESATLARAGFSFDIIKRVLGVSFDEPYDE